MKLKKWVVPALASTMLATAPVAALASENPVFGGATYEALDTKQTDKVVGQGYYSDLYGYYGLLYSNNANYYGLLAYYYGDYSYYYTAYVYAYYSADYFYYAYVYGYYGY